MPSSYKKVIVLPEWFALQPEFPEWIKQANAPVAKQQSTDAGSSMEESKGSDFDTELPEVLYVVAHASLQQDDAELGYYTVVPDSKNNLEKSIQRIEDFSSYTEIIYTNAFGFLPKTSPKLGASASEQEAARGFNKFVARHAKALPDFAKDESRYFNALKKHVSKRLHVTEVCVDLEKEFNDFRALLQQLLAQPDVIAISVSQQKLLLNFKSRLENTISRLSADQRNSLAISHLTAIKNSIDELFISLPVINKPGSFAYEVTQFKDKRKILQACLVSLGNLLNLQILKKDRKEAYLLLNSIEGFQYSFASGALTLRSNSAYATAAPFIQRIGEEYPLIKKDGHVSSHNKSRIFQASSRLHAANKYQREGTFAFALMSGAPFALGAVFLSPLAGPLAPVVIAAAALAWVVSAVVFYLKAPLRMAKPEPVAAAASEKYSKGSRSNSITDASSMSAGPTPVRPVKDSDSASGLLDEKESHPANRVAVSIDGSGRAQRVAHFFSGPVVAKRTPAQIANPAVLGEEISGPKESGAASGFGDRREVVSSPAASSRAEFFSSPPKTPKSQLQELFNKHCSTYATLTSRSKARMVLGIIFFEAAPSLKAYYAQGERGYLSPAYVAEEISEELCGNERGDLSDILAAVVKYLAREKNVSLFAELQTLLSGSRESFELNVLVSSARGSSRAPRR